MYGHNISSMVCKVSASAQKPIKSGLNTFAVSSESISDATEMYGLYRSGVGGTLRIYQGMGTPTGAAWILVEEITVTAVGGTFNTDGNGAEIEPIRIAGESVKIEFQASGNSNDFQLLLMRR